jgi:hypothetical protein
MRDPGNLPHLLARDLAGVRWPEPAQIRARGRRRTLRTVAAAPLVLAVVVASVWLVARPAADRAAPVPGGGRSSTPATVPPGWFGPEDLVQPADVGEGYHLTNEHAYAPGEYPAWAFAMGNCAAFEGLGITVPPPYTWMRINIVARDGDTSGESDVHAELNRYQGIVAEQVMTDARRALEACADFSYEGGEASTEERPARTVHQIRVVDEGFAGEDAFMTRHYVYAVDPRTGERLDSQESISLTVAVRVGDRVEVLMTSQDDANRMREIAVRAARRL